jgi:ATP adenylyltransferase
MKELWAPWRMQYILEEKNTGCFLCKALEENEDKKNLILYRGDNVFVIMNRYPYNNGHLMLVPNRHIGELDELNSEEMLELMNVLTKMKKVLDKTLKPEGYNIGINLGKVAGAGVEDHLHIHIVPRWNGDTNFMPVIADTKVMPEYLEKTYEKIIANIG